MNSKRLLRDALPVLFALIAIATGCSRSLAPFTQNQRPSVELSQAPTRSEGSQSIAYRIQWSGTDPDGSVSHFEYAIDPPTQAQVAAGRETTWVRTELREYSLEFASAPRRASQDKRALRTTHTFVLRAVDSSADPATRKSPLRAWVFDELGVAPEVRIVSPTPSALLAPVLPSPVDIVWQGLDPDGQISTQPAYYRHRLFGPADGAAFSTWLADPDSLRRFYEPLGYAGWDSSGGAVDRIALDSLQANARYLFVVVAFDETGTPSGVFSLNSNMLQFYAAHPASTPPDLHVGWSFGSYVVAPRSLTSAGGTLRFEIPAEREFDLTWFAIPPPGGRIKGIQWAIDPTDLMDDTQRDNELTDWHRWSRASLTVTTARIGPFPAGERHMLYFQVFDNGGRVSLWSLELQSIGASLNRDLLVVDDTRLRGDSFLATGGGQCLSPYPASTRWPTAAELDTFLYAVGDVPWRGIAANCPAPVGTAVSSTPGILAGYSFDTLGTRRGFEQVSNSVPLSVLGQYRHIIWMVDTEAALSINPIDLARPMTALRYMSEAGRSSTLDAYIRLGGKVWLVGAGAPLANMIGHNRTSNDQGLFGMVFSSLPGDPSELVPGRMMFDRFHWRSEFIVGRATHAIVRSESVQGAVSLERPDYSSLPLVLRRKTPATDAMPPTRPTSQTAAFYLAQIDVAYLTSPNSIIEDVDPDPVAIDEQSTLDTLYSLDAPAGNLHPSGATYPRPVMTYYRGPSAPPSVVSGFGLWNLARPDAEALTQFVLSDLWQLPRPGKLPRRAVALADRRSR